MPVEAGGFGMPLEQVQNLSVYQLLLLSFNEKHIERSKRRHKMARIGDGDEAKGLAAMKAELRLRITGSAELLTPEEARRASEVRHEK